MQILVNDARYPVAWPIFCHNLAANQIIFNFRIRWYTEGLSVQKPLGLSAYKILTYLYKYQIETKEELDTIYYKLACI